MAIEVETIYEHLLEEYQRVAGEDRLMDNERLLRGISFEASVMATLKGPNELRVSCPFFIKRKDKNEEVSLALCKCLESIITQEYPDMPIEVEKGPGDYYYVFKGREEYQSNRK